MRAWNRVFYLIVMLFILSACQPDPLDEPDISIDDTPLNDTPNDGAPNSGGNGNNIGNGLSALPLSIIEPANNPTTTATAELGRALFWDPILSGNMDIACATCHHPSHGYADGIPTSIGVGGQGLADNRQGGVQGRILRNSPTIINTAYNGININGNYEPTLAPMFWDNRDVSLENQAIGPIHSLEEMRGNNFTVDQIIPEIIRRLSANDWYRIQFADAFGPTNAITQANIAKAIAAFERTIISNNSPFDQFMRGDENALSAQQQRGLDIFQQVGCADCHSGPMLSDYELHTLGVREGNNATPDVGAGNFNFRTPSLRNVSLTAPYMHNGEHATLQEVLQFYDRNNNNSQNNNVPNNRLAAELRNLQNLNQGEQRDIIAFLNSLTDTSFDRAIPTTVPSGLSPAGLINN